MTSFCSIQSRAPISGRGYLAVLLAAAAMGGAMSGTAAAAPRRGGVAIGAAPGGQPAVAAAPGGQPAVEGVVVDPSVDDAGVVDESLAEAPAAGGGATLEPAARNRPLELVWHYLFRIPIQKFEQARRAREHRAVLDWSSDGCSGSPDHPLGFDFLPSCQRHDFGYRNYKRLRVFNERTRKVIDDHLKQDLYNYCGQFAGLDSARGVACRRAADLYYIAVRRVGS